MVGFDLSASVAPDPSHVHKKICLSPVIVCKYFGRTAEELLMTKPQGYFLIRVSESRAGYTLSYRYVTGKRYSFHSVSSHKVPPLPLSGHQSSGPLQTFHDRYDGGRLLHHSGGEEASPVSDGPGGLSLPDSHCPVQ